MHRSDDFQIAIIGGGIAGFSAAAELSEFERVIVLERESQPAYHSTGRSAAILAQTYGNDVVRALTRASDDFLNSPPDGFAERPLLTCRGLVRIARADQADALREMFETLENTGYLRWIDGDEIERRVPLIRPGYAAAGFLNSDARDIDVHAMMQGYARRIRANGGEILTKTDVTAMQFYAGEWRIEAGAQVIHARQVVNAAGSWADDLARLAGITPIGLTPLRRSAVTFDPPPDVDITNMPMVVDADEAFYLKPEAGKLLASPANETPSLPTDSQPDEMEVAHAVDRVTTAFQLDVRRIVAKWAGLRTFLPDRTPICGYDADAPGFFWLAGQGGFGIQTAPALARLTAHLMADAPMHPLLQSSGLDISALSPQRFLTRDAGQSDKIPTRRDS
ncbi:NAD(P)/FAD-dependent oxidoreductase [Pseudooceanicola sp. C21-150M6]|uniref:NAD(P)/FAD-dependent oxidoreductase n=1 Tax=Pseudooceanicola sp. C21-150M6 TaxID=3434355 RepID=UPI003D7F466C